MTDATADPTAASPVGVDADAPLIGITTYRQPADWGSWRRVRADLLPADYATSVERAGGIPVLIPPVASAAGAAAVVARVDGLLIAGGADVNPQRYGQEPGPHVTAWYDDRDASELWLLTAAEQRGLPLLGICRGMQLMAVAEGGTLIQHLPDVVGHARHAGGDSAYEQVPVAVDPGHRLSELIGDGLIAPCHHHQAVATHPGYTATARDADGVLQALEAEGDRFAVGVQWHPETADDPALFVGLVEAARESPRTRRRSA